jgi:hypothetical protein
MAATESRTSRTALFERLGLHVDEDEFEELLDEALRLFLPERAPRPAQADLTEREAAALAAAGLTFDRRAAGADSPVARTAAEFAALLASALTVPQAAARLDVEPSRVRQRLAEHTLYGIKLKAGWRLPLFQFADRGTHGTHGTVPNFAVVAPRLFGVHPVAVARWFTSPHVDLVVDDGEEPVSPGTWLETGRDPQRVAELADELQGVG